MVEMAFVMPLLLLLVLGIVNLGYLMAQQVEVNSAARQAGRTAVVPHGTGTATAKASAAATNAVGGTVPAVTTTASGTICGSGTSVGQAMKVKVAYANPGWLAEVPFFNIPAPSALTATAEYRCEW